ncbi:Uncharacterised protein [Mycobacteroides abscessus subsp. abscessus]|nr:Uncharacterised protein [Mycobacteroides abscessus subsp. abscessus]
MTHPVMHLKLDPRGGEQVERLSGLKLGAREQLLADDARTRLTKSVPELGPSRVKRHVATESSADGPHVGVREVVEAPVDRALAMVRRR